MADLERELNATERTVKRRRLCQNDQPVGLRQQSHSRSTRREHDALEDDMTQAPSQVLNGLAGAEDGDSPDAGTMLDDRHNVSEDEGDEYDNAMALAQARRETLRLELELIRARIQLQQV